MPQKTKRRPQPHRFGQLKVKGIRIKGWWMPHNDDDSCQWSGRDGPRLKRSR